MGRFLFVRNYGCRFKPATFRRFCKVLDNTGNGTNTERVAAGAVLALGPGENALDFADRQLALGRQERCGQDGFRLQQREEESEGVSQHLAHGFGPHSKADTQVYSCPQNSGFPQ